jgi:kynureninase
MEALEYNALPKEFDADLVAREKRFHARKGIAKFCWVNPHNTAHLVKLEQNDRCVTKLTSTNWDLVLLSSVEMKTGQYYYEIEITSVNSMCF